MSKARMRAAAKRTNQGKNGLWQPGTWDPSLCDHRRSSSSIEREQDEGLQPFVNTAYEPLLMPKLHSLMLGRHVADEAYYVIRSGKTDSQGN